MDDSDNDNDNDNNNENDGGKEEEQDVGNYGMDDDVPCHAFEQSKDVDQSDDDASCSGPTDADAYSSSVRDFPVGKASAIEQDGAEHNIMETVEAQREEILELKWQLRLARQNVRRLQQ